MQLRLRRVSGAANRVKSWLKNSWRLMGSQNCYEIKHYWGSSPNLIAVVLEAGYTAAMS